MSDSDTAHGPLRVRRPRAASRARVVRREPRCHSVAAGSALSSPCSSSRSATRFLSSGSSTACGARGCGRGRSRVSRPTCSTSGRRTSQVVPVDRRAARWSRCRADTCSTSTPNASTWLASRRAWPQATPPPSGTTRPGRWRSTTRRSRCGAVTCSPTSRTTTSWRRTALASTSCARRHCSRVCRPSSTWDTISECRRAGGATQRGPPARGPARTAHPRAVPVGPAVRRVGRLPRSAFGAGHGARYRAKSAAAGAQHQGAPAGPVAGLDAPRSDRTRQRGPRHRARHYRPALHEGQRRRLPPWPLSRSPWRPLRAVPGCRSSRRRGAAGRGGELGHGVDASGRVLASVPVGTNPIAVAFSQGVIWVVNASDDTVSKINPATHAVQDVIDVGHEPRAIAATGDDLWVTNFGDGSVSRINVEVGREVDTIAVGSGPDAIAAGPAGLWVANSKDNTIQRIDSATSTPGDPIDVDDGPDGLAVDDTSVWVANGRSGSVTADRCRDRGRDEGTDPGGQRSARDHPGRRRRVGGGRALPGRDPDRREQRTHGNDPRRRRAKFSCRLWRVHLGGREVLGDCPDRPRHRKRSGSRSMPQCTAWRSPAATSGSPPVRSPLPAIGGGLRIGFPATFCPPRSRGGIDPARLLRRLELPGEPDRLRRLVALQYSGADPQVLVPDLADAVPTPINGDRTYILTSGPGSGAPSGNEVLASDFVLRRAARATRPRHTTRLLRGHRRRPGVHDDREELRPERGGVVADDAAGPGDVPPRGRRTRCSSTSCAVRLPHTARHPRGQAPLAAARHRAVPGCAERQGHGADADPQPLVPPVVRSPRSPPASPTRSPGGPCPPLATGGGGGAGSRGPHRRDPRGAEGGARRGEGARRATGGSPCRAGSTTPRRWAPSSRASTPRGPRSTTSRRVAPRTSLSTARRRSRFARPSLAQPTCQLMPPRMPPYRAYCPYTSGPPDGHLPRPRPCRARALVRARDRGGRRSTSAPLSATSA